MKSSGRPALLQTPPSGREFASGTISANFVSATVAAFRLRTGPVAA